jgi:hypothetical protein
MWTGRSSRSAASRSWTCCSATWIQFVGRGGQVLQDVGATEATYTFTETEGYVRAKIFESNGYLAWCQPVMIGGGSAPLHPPR